MANKIFVLTLLLTAMFLSGTVFYSNNDYWKHEDHSRSIKFSHKFHLIESGAECTVCHHQAVKSNNSADDLMGDHESCSPCHEESITENCGYCHIDPENITGISNPERELIFSHEIHTNKEIECTQCHQGLEKVEYATVDNMPEMSGCNSCHNEKNIENECETCHLDFISLIPPDHLRGVFRKDHKRITRLGGDDVKCSICHTESFCQDCHTGINLDNFGLYNDLMGDPVPRVSIKDSPDELKIQKVHSLNYKYTHGVDAKSRALDCNVCHERQSFCSECHRSGTLEENKVKPANHREAGFLVLGRGNGGGRHAVLAKRDIEYCSSCHEVEGADPICMLCHTEDGGIR